MTPLQAAAPQMLRALRAVEEQLSTVYPNASTRAYVRAAIAAAQDAGEPYTSAQWQLAQLEAKR